MPRRSDAVTNNEGIVGAARAFGDAQCAANTPTAQPRKTPRPKSASPPKRLRDMTTEERKAARTARRAALRADMATRFDAIQQATIDRVMREIEAEEAKASDDLG